MVSSRSGSERLGWPAHQIRALTLAILLSIDTLKTCVVLDALTRTRHNSNRELVGQGFGNLASTLFGGVPGAGQMGATLVNMSSGGQTRLSGLIEGALAIVASPARQSRVLGADSGSGRHLARGRFPDVRLEEFCIFCGHARQSSTLRSSSPLSPSPRP